MRIIIDVTAGHFLIVLNPSERKAHHYVEGDATVSRTYSALTLGQLQRLYKNTTGFELAVLDYNAAIQACKYLAIKLLTTERDTAYALEETIGEKADVARAGEKTEQADAEDAQ